MSTISDCTSSRIVYEELIDTVNKINNKFSNNFSIILLDLYNPNDAVKADELNVFDAPCITCKKQHLQGLVNKDIIYEFLKQFIGND